MKLEWKKAHLSLFWEAAGVIVFACILVRVCEEWGGVVRPCPPDRKDIVTPRYSSLRFLRIDTEKASPPLRLIYQHIRSNTVWAVSFLRWDGGAQIFGKLQNNKEKDSSTSVDI